MTTFLKYYSRENEKHADADAVKVDFATAVKMTDALCRHFKVPKLRVKLFDRTQKEFKGLRKVKSWYRSGSKLLGREPEIVYHPTMLTPLTVAHEVGHYIDEVRCREAKVRRVRFHSVKHRQITDESVQVLKLHKLFSPLFTDKVARDSAALDAVLKHGIDFEVTIATAQAQLVNEFYAKLPEKLTCPCCNAHIPKQNFGVRVMKRDAAGIPLVIRRQSYCKSCR